MFLSDQGALAIAFVVALLLLTFLGQMAIAFYFNRRKCHLLRIAAQRIGEIRPTPLGPFYNSLYEWFLDLQVGASKLLIRVADVNGAPDPHAIKELPEILDQLPLFETQARELAAGVTSEHNLDSILAFNTELDPPHFTLRFSRWSLPARAEHEDDVDDDEADVVIVEFRGGKAVSWTRIAFDSFSNRDDGSVLGRTMPIVESQGHYKS